MPRETTSFDEIKLTRGLNRNYLDARHTLEAFRVKPVVVQDDGTVASGVDTEVNAMAIGTNVFELSNIGTQTIIVPILETAGLEVGRDKTVAEGSEINQGITARSPAAFVIGTDAFFFKCRVKLADVSGVAECAVGFRNIGAYAPAIDNYLDMAVLNVQGTAINIETILNNAATTTTDTTNTWADAAEKTLEVYVAKSGAVTYKISGAAPTVTAAFTFDSGDTVVPFFLAIHAATLPGKIHLVSWEVGLQS